MNTPIPNSGVDLVRALRRWLVLLLLGAGLLVETRCQGEGTVYTSRSAFNAAIGSSTTATFEDLIPSSPSSTGTALIVDSGIKFTNAGTRLFITNPAGPINPILGTGQYLWNFDSGYPVGIYLPDGVTAFGADFSGGMAPPTNFNATVTATLADGQTYDYNFSGLRGSWTFFGVTFSQPIVSLVYSDGGQNFPGNPPHEEMIDNVTFYKAVPGPITNLLANPGAETGTTTNWVVGGDSNPGVNDGSFDPGINPHSGAYHFYGHNGAAGTLSQTVFLPGNQGIKAVDIDAGRLVANVSFWEQGLNQGTPSDEACVIVSFLDSNTNLISTNSTPFIDSHNSAWQSDTNQYAIPSGTRLITYTMYFLRNVGSDNDSFIDDNVLTITPGTGPTLTIKYFGNQIVVAWPSASTGWMLQTNNNLSTGIWGNYPGPVADNSVTNPAPAGNLFFRLAQP